MWNFRGRHSESCWWSSLRASYILGRLSTLRSYLNFNRSLLENQWTCELINSIDWGYGFIQHYLNKLSLIRLRKSTSRGSLKLLSKFLCWSSSKTNVFFSNFNIQIKSSFSTVRSPQTVRKAFTSKRRSNANGKTANACQ